MAGERLDELHVHACGDDLGRLAFGERPMDISREFDVAVGQPGVHVVRDLLHWIDLLDRLRLALGLRQLHELPLLDQDRPG